MCVHGGVDDEGALLSALDLHRRAPGPAEVVPTKGKGGEWVGACFSPRS